jgi:hypothetical protein
MRFVWCFCHMLGNTGLARRIMISFDRIGSVHKTFVVNLYSKKASFRIRGTNWSIIVQAKKCIVMALETMLKSGAITGRCDNAPSCYNALLA